VNKKTSNVTKKLLLKIIKGHYVCVCECERGEEAWQRLKGNSNLMPSSHIFDRVCCMLKCVCTLR